MAYNINWCIETGGLPKVTGVTYAVFMTGNVLKTVQDSDMPSMKQ